MKLNKENNSIPLKTKLKKIKKKKTESNFPTNFRVYYQIIYFKKKY